MKRVALVANLCIAVVLVGISFVVFTVDLSGVFITVSAPLTNGNRANNNVALMIRVCEISPYVALMGEMLAQHDVDATFFVTGAWVSSNMELTAQLATNFEIGNHAWNHHDMRNLSESRQRNEISSTSKLIDSVTAAMGQTVNLFTPPKGNFSRTTLRAAERQGLTTVMWSRDTEDNRMDCPDTTFTRATENVRNGDIVLIHPTSHTLLALPRIIEHFQSNGMNLTRVSNAL